MTRDDINKATREIEEFCTKVWDENHTVNNGLYTLPLKDHAVAYFPSAVGGANWGGASYDPELKRLFVNAQNIVVYRPPLNHPLAGEGFAFGVDGTGRPRIGAGVPCFAPPYGQLSAVDMTTGKIAWQVPLGSMDAIGEKGTAAGTYNIGGILSNAGGLVFIGATNDRMLRAFDPTTGAELWKAELPADAHSTPVTYMGRDGKQYVAIAAGGGTAIGSRFTSDTFIAFSLP